MALKFIEYPKCSTCRKAKNYLIENHIAFVSVDIVKDTPTKEELEYYLSLTNLSIDRFFNTSGLKYRELNLKTKIDTLSVDEKLELLSQDGMLIRRPLLVGEDFILIGYKEKEYKEKLKKEGI